MEIDDKINSSKETDKSFNDIEMTSAERAFDEIVIFVICIFIIYNSSVL